MYSKQSIVICMWSDAAHFNTAVIITSNVLLYIINTQQEQKSSLMLIVYNDKS